MHQIKYLKNTTESVTAYYGATLNSACAEYLQFVTFIGLYNEAKKNSPRTP